MGSHYDAVDVRTSNNSIISCVRIFTILLFLSNTYQMEVFTVTEHQPSDAKVESKTLCLALREHSPLEDHCGRQMGSPTMPGTRAN